MQSNLKPWRESASLIILAKNIYFKDKWNYKILTLKRSSNVKFMPNLHAFPGGVIEKTDSVQDWFKLYQKFGIKKEYFDKLANYNQPPIFKNQDESEIPRYLSLRISAIRETFEECGILICKSAQTSKNGRQNSQWASFFGGHDIVEWQKKVHEDSTQFLELCYKFKIYPDVWALKEWSNWLTPFTMSRQFDTIFFMASFQTIPPSVAERNEVQHLEWATPMDYLNKNNEKKIMLAPPQFYEISRLTTMYDIDTLVKFAHDRSFKGCERYLPYRLSTPENDITILPGDDLYPSEEILLQKEMLTFDKIPESKTMHRLIHSEAYKINIITSNFTPKYGHIIPYIYEHQSKY